MKCNLISMALHTARYESEPMAKKHRSWGFCRGSCWPRTNLPVDASQLYTEEKPLIACMMSLMTWSYDVCTHVLSVVASIGTPPITAYFHLRGLCTLSSWNCTNLLLAASNL